MPKGGKGFNSAAVWPPPRAHAPGTHAPGPPRSEVRWLNARPAIVSRLATAHPRDAPRACMTLDVDEQGRVTDVHIVSAPDKLEGVRFPE